MMRLGSYYAEGGHTRACGLGDDDALVDLNRADATLPTDLQQILGRLDELGPWLARLLREPLPDYPTVFQNRTSQWTLGKSFDTFAPIGPFLVTADEVADPQNLDLSVTVSGTVMQQSSTANMVFSVARLVSLLSEVITLEPGDLIATGTPGGVGAAQTPPRFLRDGDVVEVAIEGLGALRNPVTSALAGRAPDGDAPPAAAAAAVI